MSLLLVAALPQETENHLEAEDILYTGVGKVQAAAALARTLAIRAPRVVLNVGTAGSAVFKAGTVVCCTGFVQRDMDVSPLGFARYQTPYSQLPLQLAHAMPVPGYPTAICGSGDNFATDANPATPWQLVDMEAYALAYVCQQAEVPFACLKYISDGADGQAAADWPQALAQAARALAAAVAAAKPQLLRQAA